MYTIQKVAKITHTTVRAIKYYEEIGLIHPQRNSAGYRIYDNDDVENIEAIQILKMYGLSLKEIKVLIPKNDLKKKIQIYDLQIDYLENQIQLLNDQKDFLRQRSQLLHLYQEHSDFCQNIHIQDSFEFYPQKTWETMDYLENGLHTILEYYKNGQYQGCLIKNNKGKFSFSQNLKGYFLEGDISQHVQCRECALIPFHNKDDKVISFCIEIL